MTGPSIDVIIPTLGRSTLERAVRSAVAQSYRPDTVIIVSNGAEELRKSRIESIRIECDSIALVSYSLPPFSGPGLCRNVGAWTSSADYIAFLDDDDAFHPDYLDHMSRRIMQTTPDILFATKMKRRINRPNRVTRMDRFDPNTWAAMLFEHDNPGVGGDNLVVERSRFFSVGGFPFDLPTAEDRGFALAALTANRSIEFVSEAIVECYDSEGYRAGEDPRKWLVNLKLTQQYWSGFSWRSRLRSVWRLIRSFRRFRNPK